MRKLSFRSSSVPVVLLVLCILSFGLVASQVGFYWDDWFYSYFNRFFGAADFWEAFQEDRPLASGLFYLTGRLVGGQPLSWQIFALATRWLACLAVWWTLNALWPGKTRQIATVTFLFALYPGFRQQHIAILYSNWFIVMAFFMASLGAMSWAVRKPGWFWPLFLLSLPLSGYAMAAVEYFFGLELLRPIFLWLVLKDKYDNTRQRLQRAILYWIPYLAIMLAFLAWRMLSPSERGTITIFSDLAANPFKAIFNLLGIIIGDVFEVSVLAWAQVLDFSKLAGYGWTVILGVGVVIAITAGLVIFYLPRLNGAGEDTAAPGVRQSWAVQAILLGLIAILLGGIPFWMTTLQITLHYPRDRFTMSMMLGTALLFAGLCELITLKRWPKVPARVVVLGVALGLAAGMHFQIGLNFRKEWIAQKDFFWQLTWRAPGFQTGTAVLTTDIPFPYDNDHSLLFPLNWTYDPLPTGRELKYMYYNVESHLSRGLDTLTEDTPIEISYRLNHFEGSFAQAVFVIYRPPACLKVIDPILDQNLPGKPQFFREALPFSDPSLINVNASPGAQPPDHLFSPEPDHGWCYSFQKADLARQQKDWQKIVELGDLALGNKRFDRNNVTEIVPFIEGYAHVGQWDKAMQLSLEAQSVWGNMRLMLCNVWADIAQTTASDPQQEATLLQAQETFECRPEK